MSGDNYHRGSRDYNRNVNAKEGGGLTISKNFNNDNRGRYNNNDNRGRYNNNDNRGRYNNDNRGNYNNNQGRGNFHGRGGGRGGGRGDAPKRLPGNMMPRKEEEVPTAVKLAQQLMTRVGDFSALGEDDDMYTNVKALASTFASVGDLTEFSEEISALFVKCFCLLSVQSPIFSALLALVHTQEAKFAALVAEKLQHRYLQAVSEDDVVTAKLVLRAVACLQACGSFQAEGAGGLLEVLQGLLTPVSEELSAAYNSDANEALRLSPGAQAHAYLLASTLVWAAPALQKLPAAEALLTAAQGALQRVVAGWCSSYSVGGLQAVFSTYSPPEAEEEMDTAEGVQRSLCVGPGAMAAGGAAVKADGSAWDTLWEACAHACSVLDELVQCAAQGETYVFPSYMNAYWGALQAEEALPECAEQMLSFGAQFQEDWTAHSAGLGSKAVHCVPAGVLTSVVGSSTASTWLRMRMSIFDVETSPECASCCALSVHAKYTAQGYFEDVLAFFDPVINEDGTKLGSLDLLTTHLMAVFKLFPAEAHLEYLLVEGLMQVVLQQPVNTALSASVFRLILELCRHNAQLFAPVVALAANTVFQLVPDLDVGASQEFGRWFAFHLENTQLSWPQEYWSFWLSEMQEGAEAGQQLVPLFVRSIVERLSFSVVPDRLKAALPSALHGLIHSNTPAHCSLLTASTEGEPAQTSMLAHIPGIADAAQQLRAKLEQKADPEDVSDWLEAFSLADEGCGVCWRGCLALQVLIHVAATGNESALSAVVGLLDRYSEVLLATAATEQDHLDLLAMLREVYGANNYMFHYLLDEMLRRGQISVSAAATAVTSFDQAGAADWTSDPSSYRCLESTLDRAVDFVKAAAAQRSQLGVGFCLDETADLSPSAAPEEAPRKRASVGGQVEEGMDEGEGDDEDDRRKRSRRGDEIEEGTGEEGDAMQTAEAVEEESEVDPLWAADEGLKSALRNSRAVYATVTGALQRLIAAHPVTGAVDAGYIAASLLRHTLRVFHGAERHLSHQHQQRAVLSVSGAQLQQHLEKLRGTVADSVGVAPSRWWTQLQTDRN